MALINGALQIGKSAITTSQAALAVTGNNMANAATPSYSRQTPQLRPTQYTEVVPGKYTGTGVALWDVRRQVDDALNGRIRAAVGDAASFQVQQQAMTRVESTLNELTDEDLSSRLSQFFQAWADVQNQPEESAARSVVLQEGSSLANFVQEMRSDLGGIVDDLDTQVRFQVSEASSLAAQVADLNQQVVVAEAGRAGSAAALRDQRDELLKQLGQLVNITTREAEGGAVLVFIGNDPLVQYADSRELTYRESGDENGESRAEVVFGDNQQAVSLSSGKIHGLITARDDQVGGAAADLDAWTKAFIYEVNKLHALGRGLEGFSSVSSSELVEDADASLADTSATGLPWAVSNGVFYVNVTDQAGNLTTHMIQVKEGIDSSDTTLNQLAAALDGIDNINASVDAAGRLTITADSNFTFGFSSPAEAEDASNVLAVLGINTFFQGSSAGDIAVRSGLTDNPNAVAASSNGEAGNGDVAGQIAQLAVSPAESLNGLSITERFTGLVGQIAADSKAAQDNYTAADVISQTLESERQGISGVSVDEEAIHMIMFQRAFQGAARYVGVIDQMLNEVIQLGA